MIAIPFVECSTPFGVRGRITQARENPHARSGVLNAFRRQRTDHIIHCAATSPSMECSTPFGVRGRITRPSDEDSRALTVLNAFRRQRTDHDGIDRKGERGQRVLNAFRRQRTDHDLPQGIVSRESRCSTPFGVRGRITRHFLLMSIVEEGAQRLSASEDGSLPGDWCRAARALGCSTPFGVRGRITPFLLPRRQDLLQVLNAFRRQRTDHTIFLIVSTWSRLCSTPFGVRGRIT